MKINISTLEDKELILLLFYYLEDTLFELNESMDFMINLVSPSNKDDIIYNIQLELKCKNNKWIIINKHFKKKIQLIIKDFQLELIIDNSIFLINTKFTKKKINELINKFINFRNAIKVIKENPILYNLCC